MSDLRALFKGNRFVPLSVAFLVAGFLCNLAWQAMAQSQHKKVVPKQESFTRPEPKKPIRPTIPEVSRYQSNKVFLENADSLVRHGEDSLARQIVLGNVKFRQGNMWMYCDSAYYYPAQNSMDAFSNVRMQQGDTLFVYADRLIYDGTLRIARLFNGPTCQMVKLKDPRGVLTTDSLLYDLNVPVGIYQSGGKLEDNVNTLTSVIGEYYTDTKEANFFSDVELINHKDDYKLYSDTLYYNTATKIARIVSPTRIYGPTDTILTRSGWYNTETNNLELTSRSIIQHTDSAGNATTLEGDSIIYDKRTRISRAYMYRDRMRNGRPIVITDTAHKSILYGGEGIYNDSTREAYAMDYPLLVNYSRPDTLFLRADTIYTRTVTDTLPNFARAVTDSLSVDSLSTDSLSMESGTPEMKDFHIAKALSRARFFNNRLQGVADTIVYFERDSLMDMLRRPMVWSDNRQISGDTITVHFNDSTADRAFIRENGVMGEHVEEDFYNQLAGREIRAWFTDETLDSLRVTGNVQTIFLPQESDSTYSRLVYAESSELSATMEKDDIKHLKMWPEVTGDVTPIFLVKPSQKTLQWFTWNEAVRPRREWYGDRLKWADDLGEVPDELDAYFKAKEDPGKRRMVPKGAEDLMKAAGRPQGLPPALEKDPSLTPAPTQPDLSQPEL